MSFPDIIVLAAGLSMDAFAAAVCKGLSLRNASLPAMMTVGGYFGFFQGGMPLLCYFTVKRISGGLLSQEQIGSFTPWAAFVLLSIIGINMIRESRRRVAVKSEHTDPLAFSSMIAISFATSIDAFATGFTLLGMGTRQVIYCVACIAAITFVFCAAGVKVGAVFGSRYKSKAELAGGIVLVSLGLKFLIKDALLLL